MLYYQIQFLFAELFLTSIIIFSMFADNYLLVNSFGALHYFIERVIGHFSNMIHHIFWDNLTNEWNTPDVHKLVCGCHVGPETIN